MATMHQAHRHVIVLWQMSQTGRRRGKAVAVQATDSPPLALAASRGRIMRIPCGCTPEPAMRIHRLATLSICLLSVPALSAEPAPDTSRGDRMFERYFRSQTKQ